MKRDSDTDDAERRAALHTKWTSSAPAAITKAAGDASFDSDDDEEEATEEPDSTMDLN